VKGFAVAALALTVSALAGRRLMRRALPHTTFLTGEGALLGGVLTLGVVATLVIVVGAAGGWHAAFFGALMVVLALIAWRWPVPPDNAPLPVQAPPCRITRVWIAFCAVISAVYLIGAACPEIFFDSLHYHLAVLTQYELHGRLQALPTLFYSSFMSTIQMLYGWVHALGGVFSAKFMHALLALMLIPAYWLFSRRYFLSPSGWLAALIVLSMPLSSINATTAGTDVAGAFFFFASAFALVRALEMSGPRGFWIAGLLTGIAASCKYPTLPFIPIAALLIVWERRHWRDALHFIVAATVAVLPLLIKNIALYGNPIYPFLGTQLGHPVIAPAEWTQFVSDTGTQSLPLVFSSWPAFKAWVLQPWSVSFGSAGTVGPLLLMGLPLIFFGPSPSLAFRTLRRYAILAWLLWLATTTIPRYSLPAAVLTAPLIAEALYQIPPAAWIRWIGWGAFALGIVINLHMQLLIFFNWNGWNVLAGRASESAYLQRMWATYPTPPYEALEWMNANLPKDAVVLFAGEARSYYLRRRAIPSSIPGVQPIVAWSQESKTGDALAKKMRAEGVTHIFVNYVEAMRTEGYGAFKWTPAGWATLDDFWKHHIRFIWKKEDPSRENPQALYVYELASEEMSKQPHAPPPNPFERWKPK